jgi:hypothetical protein
MSSYDYTHIPFLSRLTPSSSIRFTDKPSIQLSDDSHLKYEAVLNEEQVKPIHGRPARRLIDRSGDFHQSNGSVYIRKKINSTHWRALYGVAWFHSLVDAPTSRVVGILMACYLLTITAFAAMYYWISKRYSCNLGIDNMIEAFSFSLETMATIGYSTQDYFFDDCIVTIFVLYMQICIKIVSDALTIGIIYCRLSRPQSRSSTVIFSNKAVIRRIRGKLYFMFQLCELRKHQLVEAHVRLYVVRREV